MFRFLVHVLACTYLGVGAFAVAQNREEKVSTPNYVESQALLIAVSEYEHWTDLPKTVDDVKAVKKVLESQGFIVEKPVINPTLGRMRNSIQKFFTNKCDRLLLYYAGHGRKLRQKFDFGGTTSIVEDYVYLLPKEAPTLVSADPTVPFRNSAINGKDIVKWAEQSQAKHIMVVVDACSSGLIHHSVRYKRLGTFNISANKPVRVYLSSGVNKAEVSATSDFREEFLKAITSKDGDNQITDYEMYKHVVEAVNNRLGAEPKLSTTSEKTRFVFFPK